MFGGKGRMAVRFSPTVYGSAKTTGCLTTGETKKY
jgi:hypothetical protein